jgi:hypothetical protein
VPKAPPGEGATVSFLRKRQSSTPLPLRERVASRPGWPGEGVPVSFLRKQQSSRCHSRVSGSPGFFAPPPVSLPRKRQPRTTLDSLGPASYPAALKQAHSSLHCSSRRSVTSAASFGYTVPLRRTGHGRCSAHGSAGFFRAVWINQATMWRRALGEEAPIFSTISHQRADDVAQAGGGKGRFFSTILNQNGKYSLLALAALGAGGNGPGWRKRHKALEILRLRKLYEQIYITR